MRDLGTFRGEGRSVANSLNDQGQIVGVSSIAIEEAHAFLWQNGKMTDLGTLGGTFSEANGINEQGQVVGWSDTRDDETHAFLWQNGTMRDLGTLGGTYSQANGINDQGQVVGESTTRDDETHAFLWQNGKMRDLGTLGGLVSTAASINNQGQIVGVSRTANDERHAFLWQNGKMTNLGTLGGTYSQANGINEQGQVVGESRLPLGGGPVIPVHAVMWTLPTAPQTPPQLSLSAACQPDEYDVRQVRGTLTIVTQAPVRLDALQGALEGTTGARITFDAPVGRLLTAGIHRYTVRAQRWTAASPQAQLRLTVKATLGGQPQTVASAFFAPCAPEPPVPCTQPECADVPEIRFNVYLPALALETP